MLLPYFITPENNATKNDWSTWESSIKVNEKKNAANKPSEKAFFIVSSPKNFIC